MTSQAGGGVGAPRAAVRHSARAALSAMLRLSPEDAVASWQDSLAALRLAAGDPDARFEGLAGVIEAHYAAGPTREGLALLDAVLDARAATCPPTQGSCGRRRLRRRRPR